MLILSSFDNDKKFIEIIDINECKNIESDCYVYISIDSTLQRDLEKYFKIGKFLYQNEVQYAVLLNDLTGYRINSKMKKQYFEEDDEYYEGMDLVSNEEEISLQFLLSMFAKHGASFFIFGKEDYDLLPLAQSYANYHLFDMKILALVRSYMESGFISSWKRYVGSLNAEFIDKFIHIDGTIEDGLLIKHKTKRKRKRRSRIKDDDDWF